MQKQITSKPAGGTRRKTEVHFFVSTGGFHWNGIAHCGFMKRQKAEAKALRMAEAFAKEKGLQVKTFDIRATFGNVD